MRGHGQSIRTRSSSRARIRASRPFTTLRRAGLATDQARGEVHESPGALRPARSSTTPAASRSSRGSTASPTHEAVARALTALENLEHRGAAGADAATGDGAGHPRSSCPDAFFRGGRRASSCRRRRVRRRGLLPAARRPARRAELEQLLERTTVEAEGQRVVGWRDVPVDAAHVGAARARASRRVDPPALRRAPARAARPRRVRAQALRDPPRRGARRRAPSSSIPSFSSRTLVYKGMLTAPQLRGATTPTCATSGSRARSRSSTRASRPTRSRAGSSRTRTG